jgi:hypothetical protein
VFGGKEEMPSAKSALEIEVAIRSELLALGITADSVNAHADRVDEWSATIRIAERTFEIGSKKREGFFCCESTRDATKSFVLADCGKISGSQNRLRRHGLEIIRYAVEHPEFG